MFGRKARRIAELEKELEQTQVDRNTFEFSLLRARIGLDKETNAYFRDHPVYVTPEPIADAGAGAVVAKKASKKAK